MKSLNLENFELKADHPNLKRIYNLRTDFDQYSEVGRMRSKVERETANFLHSEFKTTEIERQYDSAAREKWQSLSDYEKQKLAYI